jgi:uncharacterized membrane protein YphA (DoxX/SURF4 family)
MNLGGPSRIMVNWLAVAARIVLGALFLYMGLIKVQHPVEFLKLLREYNLTEHALFLNLVAATLPWFEVFTGILLVCGIAVRGAGVVSLGMLVPFTIVVAQRAAAIHAAQGTPFCGIRFDCGCGGGEVLICRKLAENVGLMILALIVALVPAAYASLRYSFFGRTETVNAARRSEI